MKKSAWYEGFVIVVTLALFLAHVDFVRAADEVVCGLDDTTTIINIVPPTDPEVLSHNNADFQALKNWMNSANVDYQEYVGRMDYSNGKGLVDSVTNAIRQSNAKNIMIRIGQHGSVVNASSGQLGWTQAVGNRAEAIRFFNTFPVKPGQQISIFDQTCGSGAGCVPSAVGPVLAENPSGPVRAIFSASVPGRDTVTGVLERDIMNSADPNKDGIISANETGIPANRSFYKNNADGSAPPVFYAKGHKDGSFVVSTKYKYVGIKGEPRDETKFELLPAGGPNAPKSDLSDEKQRQLAYNITNDKLFVHLGSVDVGPHDGYAVQAHCQVNQTAGTPEKICLTKKDENNFRDCKPEYSQSPSIDNGSTGGGSSGQFTPGQQGGLGQGGGIEAQQGGAGNMASILPLLMQSLFGGAQNQGQNPYGAGYGSGGAQQSCARYGVSPVCGTDARTYTNTCWMQQLGANQKHVGVCLATPATNSGQAAVTSDINVVLGNLSTSGAPSSLIDSLKNIVASIFSNILGGGVGQTVIR